MQHNSTTVHEEGPPVVDDKSVFSTGSNFIDYIIRESVYFIHTKHKNTHTHHYRDITETGKRKETNTKEKENTTV